MSLRCVIAISGPGIVSILVQPIMMKHIFYALSVMLIGISQLNAQKQNTYTISGYVKEQGSGELLPGVTVYNPLLKQGVTTNGYGFYSLTFPAGEQKLVFSFVSYESVEKTIDLKEDIELNISLSYAITELERVEVVAEQQEKKSEESQMSLIDVPIQTIQEMPAFMGEKDVLKVLQLMPGVQSGSEGNSGLYVRGGGPDQNLIILDDAVVYNAYHLFGFFSLFNGDALKSVELYKGGFPSRFGGRLSSVVKMDMKDGNKEKLTGKYGVGLISSNFMLEGPVKSEKSSFLVSGRRTYADILSRPFQPSDFRGGYYFYDLNAKFNHEFSSQDKLYVSGYFGKDKFSSIDKEFDYTSRAGWDNATATVRWNHQFNKKLFSNTSLIFSKYNFFIREEETEADQVYELDYSSGIRDLSLKFDLDFFPSPEHAIKFGAMTTRHSFTPSALVIKDSGFDPVDTGEKYKSLESAIYIEDDMRLFNKLNINAGFRLSHFIYSDQSYLNPEPRLSLAYMLAPGLSMKASYAKMNQYIHLLSNSGIGLPTDLWVSSTDRVKPQSSQQVAFGFAKDYIDKNLSVSLEGYYKKSKDVISYKEGASFLLLDDPSSTREVRWEDNITDGEAWSYGAELLIQRKYGRFTGWLGYTLSWTQLQFEELNRGRKFFARYDRRHDVSLVGVYKKSKKVTLSGTWVYGTGNNFTLPTSTYRSFFHGGGSDVFFSDRYINYFDERNNFRAEAYHRLDFSVQFHKKKAKGMRTWEFSLYNAYSRKNPFFYYTDTNYIDNTNQREGVLKRITIFPVLPSVTYKFEF